MAIDARGKRARLNAAFDAAQLSGGSLRDYMAQQRSALAESLASGQVIASTSGSGLSVTFSESGRGTPSPDAMLGLWDELIDLFDASRLTLIAGGTPKPTDAEVVVAVLATIKPIRSVGSNFARMLT